MGAGWARGVLGGSTGGWEAFASQVLYPDFYNYAAVACPDPITFTSYSTVDLYTDRNAFYYNSPFKRTPRPAQRDHYSGTAVVPGTSRVASANDHAPSLLQRNKCGVSSFCTCLRAPGTGYT